jgi:6-phosphogluconolactonase (cycloisomerase 2 family)
MKLLSILAGALLAVSASAQHFGTVFSLDNDPTDNRVHVMFRGPTGNLIPVGSHSTGGTGTGSGLGSQGALATNKSGRTLLAVNPGSNEVSLFRVIAGIYPVLLDREPSGGMRPTSVAVHGRLVYVLNADSDSITGFRRRGPRLIPIAGATYPLSGASVAAAQVGCSPDGSHLVVTERATDTIAVFPVKPNGRLGNAQFVPSAGPTPFGFLFRDDGTLVVSEAAGGAAGASVVSSYYIDGNGGLQVVTGAAATNQAAACWIAIPKNGDFAYTTNTADGTLSGFSLDATGNLALLDPSGVTGNLGAAARPIDFDFTGNGRFLYVLDSAGDEIRGFYRKPDGSLLPLSVQVPLADGHAGLLAR